MPRLFAGIAAASLFCSVIGFVSLSGHRPVQAQNSAAPAAPPAAGRQETEAKLQRLKVEALADEQGDQAKSSSTALPMATELDVEAYGMREHLKKMRELAVEYHLSDSPSETKALRMRWVKMLETGRKIQERMVRAALNDYRADPNPKSETAEYLYSVAARNADADRFDGMLEVVKLLKDSGYTNPQFDLCFGLTAAAHNEFELARPHLQVAIKNLENGGRELSTQKDIPEEELQATLKHMSELHGLLNQLSDVDFYRPLWEKEEKMREADASGEPLPRVLIETTKGSFEVELFEDQAPNTVANFISLCEKKFYDGLPFHRVLRHFMAQGGCPNRDGTGGPGYWIRTELNDDSRNFFRGTLGMALSAQPDSAGSQFFVCYLPRAHLNGKYVAFGRVIEGMNVLSDLTHVDPEEKDKEHMHPPLDEIISTRVVRKRDHPYEPETIPEAK